MNSSDKLNAPVICVGGPRSGTTMLSHCFRRLDNFVFTGELNTLWRTGNTRVPHDRFEADLATPSIIRRIRTGFWKFQNINPEGRLFEKTPRNVFRIPFVHRVLPEARFLHIYRHGFDNVSSCLGYWMKPRPLRTSSVLTRLKTTPITDWPAYIPKFTRDFFGVRLGMVKKLNSWGAAYPGMQEDQKHMSLVQVLAKQWVNSLEIARSDLAAMDRALWIEVKYEDLVANPVEEFVRILDFFNIPMTPAFRQYLEENIHQDVVGAYRKRLSPEQIESITPIVRPKMEEMGYVIDETSPAD